MGRKSKKNAEDDNEEYEVEKLLDRRVRGGRTEYYVKWVGWQDPSWEKLCVTDCPALVKEYEDSLLEKENRSRGSKSVILSPSLKTKNVQKRKADSAEPSKKTKRVLLEESCDEDSSGPSTSLQSETSSKSKKATSDRKPLATKSTSKSSRSHTRSHTRSVSKSTEPPSSKDKSSESHVFPEVSDQSDEDSIILDKKRIKKGVEKIGRMERPRKAKTIKPKKIIVTGVITIDDEEDIQQIEETEETRLTDHRAASPALSVDSNNLVIDDCSQTRETTEASSLVNEDTRDGTVENSITLDNSKRLKEFVDSLDFFGVDSNFVNSQSDQNCNEEQIITDDTFNSSFQLVIDESLNVTIIEKEVEKPIEESIEQTIEEPEQSVDKSLNVTIIESTEVPVQEPVIISTEQSNVEQSIEESNEPSIEVQLGNEIGTPMTEETESMELGTPMTEENETSNTTSQAFQFRLPTEPEDEIQSMDTSITKAFEFSRLTVPLYNAIPFTIPISENASISKTATEPTIEEIVEDVTIEKGSEEANVDKIINNVVDTIIDEITIEANVDTIINKVIETNVDEGTQEVHIDKVIEEPIETNVDKSTEEVHIDKVIEEPIETNVDEEVHIDKVIEGVNIDEVTIEEDEIYILELEGESMDVTQQDNNSATVDSSHQDDNLLQAGNNTSSPISPVEHAQRSSTTNAQSPSIDKREAESPVFDLSNLIQMQSVVGEALKDYWKKQTLKRIMTSLENPRNYANPFTQHPETRVERFTSIFKVNGKGYVMCKFVDIDEEMPARIEDVRKTDQYYEFAQHMYRTQQRKHQVIMY